MEEYFIENDSRLAEYLLNRDVEKMNRTLTKIEYSMEAFNGRTAIHEDHEHEVAFDKTSLVEIPEMTFVKVHVTNSKTKGGIKGFTWAGKIAPEGSSFLVVTLDEAFYVDEINLIKPLEESEKSAMYKKLEEELLLLKHRLD